MNIMELSSAEKRREENIRKNREFQIQIGFTSLVEQNRVASQEKIIRQDYVKRKIVETSAIVTIGPPQLNFIRFCGSHYWYCYTGENI